MGLPFRTSGFLRGSAFPRSATLLLLLTRPAPKARRVMTLPWGLDSWDCRNVGKGGRGDGGSWSLVESSMSSAAQKNRGHEDENKTKARLPVLSVRVPASVPLATLELLRPSPSGRVTSYLSLGSLGLRPRLCLVLILRTGSSLI